MDPEETEICTQAQDFDAAPVKVEVKDSFKIVKRSRFVTQSVCYDDRGFIQSNTFALLDEINDVYLPEMPKTLLEAFDYCRKGYADF